MTSLYVRPSLKNALKYADVTLTVQRLVDINPGKWMVLSLNFKKGKMLWYCAYIHLKYFGQSVWFKLAVTKDCYHCYVLQMGFLLPVGTHNNSGNNSVIQMGYVERLLGVRRERRYGSGRLESSGRFSQIKRQKQNYFIYLLIYIK